MVGRVQCYLGECSGVGRLLALRCLETNCVAAGRGEKWKSVAVGISKGPSSRALPRMAGLARARRVVWDSW